MCVKFRDDFAPPFATISQIHIMFSVAIFFVIFFVDAAPL